MNRESGQLATRLGYPAAPLLGLAALAALGLAAAPAQAQVTTNPSHAVLTTGNSQDGPRITDAGPGRVAQRSLNALSQKSTQEDRHSGHSAAPLLGVAALAALGLAAAPAHGTTDSSHALSDCAIPGPPMAAFAATSVAPSGSASVPGTLDKTTSAVFTTSSIPGGLRITATGPGAAASDAPAVTATGHDGYNSEAVLSDNSMSGPTLTFYNNGGGQTAGASMDPSSGPSSAGSQSAGLTTTGDSSHDQGRGSTAFGGRVAPTVPESPGAVSLGLGLLGVSLLALKSRKRKPTADA